MIHCVIHFVIHRVVHQGNIGAYRKELRARSTSRFDPRRVVAVFRRHEDELCCVMPRGDRNLLQVGAEAENTSHSMRSAALGSQKRQPSLGYVMDSSLARSCSKGGRPTRNSQGHSPLLE